MLNVGSHDIEPSRNVGDLSARDLQALSRLPDDHAAWPTDAIVLSAHARSFLIESAALLKKTAVVMFGFWDHAMRELDTTLGLLGIDAAGAYRLLARS